ncbi:olfactory receptor 5I1-like [Microcaecilia unicolor]|uniref:Olfactory receptor n=1 Tax=Microcaecilia unicolor TaxID=1415580 RepID=A0A6P7X9J6_9AMPH|nr:olfactory receptor 5I1-like [Microcaecilia unicolor]
MARRNQTYVTEFILLGFSDLPKLQSLLFIVFLFMYIFTVLGNISIVTLIRVSLQLHTPMYFFISNLSILDLCYSSTITPKILVNLLAKQKSISVFECAIQFFSFATLGTAECYLLAVMAYDRYVAICNPLLYTSVMTRRMCVQLVTTAYIGGFVNSFAQIGNAFSVSFCDSKINQFFCDIPALLKLSCSSTLINEIILSVMGFFITTISLVVIILSYSYIISTILRIRSAEGRRKAFSTCTSHLTTVTLFFGTLIIMYVIPSSHYSLNRNRMVSVVYTMIIPMLNPMIYSLRNNDVKNALKKTFRPKKN